MIDEPSGNLMSAADLDALRAEIDELEGPGRERIAAQIKTAREWGDLKENGEYHAAKEAQAHLETRIAQLRERAMSAQVVEVATGGVVGFGSTVEVEDEATGKRSTYTIVASREAAPAEGKLSVESPVATGLMSHRAGDVATVSLPRGDKRLKIVSVS